MSHNIVSFLLKCLILYAGGFIVLSAIPFMNKRMELQAMFLGCSINYVLKSCKLPLFLLVAIHANERHAAFQSEYYLHV